VVIAAEGRAMLHALRAEPARSSQVHLIANASPEGCTSSLVAAVSDRRMNS